MRAIWAKTAALAVLIAILSAVAALALTGPGDDHSAARVSFLSDSSWSAIDDPSAFVSQPAGSGAKLVLSVPMLPASGATLAQEASGAYNSYFRTLAQKLVAEGRGDAVIRLGWEMNGNWFPWSIQNGNASNFAAAWRQIVDTMRSVPGQAFKFDFCLNNGSSSDGSGLLNPQNAYPGDSYVDYVGMDVYDQSWISNPSSETNRWNGYVTAPWGMQWQRQFAAAHGKPVSFPEWGLDSGGSGYGGGDSPQFIQHMFAWFQTSNLAYESYFDYNAPDGDHLLSHYPNAAAQYKTLSGEAGPVSVSVPAPPKVVSPRPTAPAHRHSTQPRRGVLRVHAASVSRRPTLDVRVFRSRTGRELVKLTWNSYGHSVAVFKNRRRISAGHHRHSLVVRPRRRTRTIAFSVCELHTHNCSRVQHVQLKLAHKG